MGRKRKRPAYSYQKGLEMLEKLQQMAIMEGRINLALKAEELKCKIASAAANKKTEEDDEELTKILVDFINDKHDCENTEDICSADKNEEKV